MRHISETEKDIILAIDERCNYSTKIGRKINRTFSHVCDTVQGLIEEKLIEFVSGKARKRTRKKTLRLTKKGRRVKEKIIEWDNLK